MKASEYDYLETKVEDTLRLLRRTNKRYSAAFETEEELYRRGYLDCLKLVVSLGSQDRG